MGEARLGSIAPFLVSSSVVLYKYMNELFTHARECITSQIQHIPPNEYVSCMPIPQNNVTRGSSSTTCHVACWLIVFASVPGVVHHAGCGAL